jgi:hypothetical protein
MEQVSSMEVSPVAQRDPNLPEGTDHIINGAMETGSGLSTGAAGGASSGFVGSGSGGFGDDTGGTATGGMSTGLGSASGLGGGATASSGSSGGAVAGLKGEARDRAQALKSQAGDKVRQYAVDGKERATSTLDEVAQAMNEAATSIDERLGADYGEYARKAAPYVQDFSGSLRGKDVDQLFDEARALVRKSPGVAIGTAAAIGFALVRLLKAGTPDGQSGGQQYSDGSLSGTGGELSGTPASGAMGTTSLAPDVYTSPGV